ncbi:hypothetical protein BLNAU_23635 [Blattamonas nauphoetae]|uniref:Uncharacterized protein n=1 Tax=Blattamonas nauphoetae TaxID=2049346 RepID=A0ABQ9WRT0_9EUKA|nr:hypothetical protein BLNAU_23635 [Blattamonas nauphoetae]
MIFLSRFGMIVNVDTIPKQNAAFVNFEKESQRHRFTISQSIPHTPASPSFHLSLPSTPAPVSLTADLDVLPVVLSLMPFGFGRLTEAEALVHSLLDRQLSGKHQLSILLRKADPTPLSSLVPRHSLATTLHPLLQMWCSFPPQAVRNPLNVERVDVRLLMKYRDPSAAHVIWKLYSVLIGVSAAEANNTVLNLTESERPPIPMCHRSKHTPAQHPQRLLSHIAHSFPINGERCYPFRVRGTVPSWAGSRHRIPLCALLVSLFIEFLFFRGQLLPFVEWILHAFFKETVERWEKEGVLEMIMTLKCEGMHSSDEDNRFLHSTQRGLSSRLSRKHRQRVIRTQTAALPEQAFTSRKCLPIAGLG